MCDSESLATRMELDFTPIETLTTATGAAHGMGDGESCWAKQQDTLLSVALRRKLDAKYGHFLKSEYAREKKADIETVEKQAPSFLPWETEDRYDDDYVPNKKRPSTAKRWRQNALKRRPKNAAKGAQKQTRKFGLKGF